MRWGVPLLPVALLAGCASPAEHEQPALIPLHSKLKFVETGVDEHRAAVAEIAEQTRRRVLDELGALPADQGSVFSPWALTRRDQIIADANSSGEDPAVAAVIGQLGKWEGDPASVPKGGVARTPILRSQTALVADRSLAVRPEFLDLLAQDYDMGVYLAAPGDPKLPGSMSAWAFGTASSRFDRPMPGLGSANGVYVADVTVLLAAWQFPFRPEFTEEAVFTSAHGEQKRVPTMRGTTLARTAEGPGWQAAQLPLSDGIEMRVVMPDNPRADLTDVLPPARSALAEAGPAPLGVALPRWSARADLVGAPRAAALPPLPRLAPGAEASGWASQAAAAFGEQGLSLAAAPEGTAPPGAADLPPRISFAVDRPFCFEVFDPGTGLVLLAGRVADPSR